MRKSLIAFIILTVVFFSIFSELLAIRKEAIFDEYANDFIRDYETSIEQWKSDIDADAKEYTHDEISKEFYYNIMNETIYVRQDLIDAHRELLRNNHRRIPIIGMIDVYKNIYCAANFDIYTIIVHAGASGSVMRLEEETKVKFSEYSGLNEALTTEQLNDFKESEEYTSLMNEYYDKISNIEGKGIEDYHKSVMELENPIKNPFSARRMILSSILSNYKVFTEKKYREYLQDVKRGDFVKATVDAHTVRAISLHSKHIKEGEINPQFGVPSLELPSLSNWLLIDTLILIFCSITVAFVIFRIIFRKISPVMLGSLIGGIMSIALYRNYFFFLWIPMGGVVSAYKSVIKRKRDILIIGIETGMLMTILNFSVGFILSLFGLSNVTELDIQKSPFNTLESAMMYLIGVPLMFIVLSLIGSFVGFLIRTKKEKSQEKKNEEKEGEII